MSLVLQARTVLVAVILAVSMTGLSAEPRTIEGEVVDVRCHEKAWDNAGAAHADCALSCARRGATLGIRTPEGVYVIVGEFTVEMNRRLIEFVAQTVEATGEIADRDGKRLIHVREIKKKQEIRK